MQWTFVGVIPYYIACGSETILVTLEEATGAMFVPVVDDEAANWGIRDASRRLGSPPLSTGQIFQT